ncbi:MAG: cysteine hydrolase [Defluviitaleaceae bacterium]|nr:cysteine hydrolase [Defluviitaleaceae bacterium]
MKALVIVDMQNDFIDGALGTKEAAAIVDHVVARIKESNDELILFTQDTHGEDYLSTPEGKKLPVPHCIENTDGWKINESIFKAWCENKNTVKADRVAENCFVDNTITKPIFGSERLVEFLKTGVASGDVTEIELLGLCTDICVVSNAIMLKNALPNIEVSVNEKCCAGVTPQSHTEALNTMKMCQINII